MRKDVIEVLEKDERNKKEKKREEAGDGGRCWTTMTHWDGRAEVPLLPCSLVVSVQRISLFTVPSGAPLARTHISKTDASKVVTPANLCRCGELAR